MTKKNLKSHKAVVFHMIKIHKASRKSQPQGLVLLVVLGMLGLFSLLAISYLTISGNSRNSSKMAVLAKLQQLPTSQDDTLIVRQIISGTTDSKSGFFGHGLLEDVYGRDPIEGRFRYSATAPLTSELIDPNSIGLVKLQLDDDIRIHPDTYRLAFNGDEASFFSKLSVENDTYTGRLITFLEGPLKNQTFRILTYIGSPGVRVPPGGAIVPNLEYSITIDLSTATGSTSPVAYTATAGGTPQLIQKTLREWMQTPLNNPATVNTGLPLNPAYLVADPTGAGYQYLINDLPFNGVGYGVEKNPALTTFGNLDQSTLVPGTSGNSDTGYAPGSESFPIALLPNYDYLNTDPRLGGLGYATVGGLTVEVNGSTNEGIDVADYRDYYLAHLPELVNPITGAALNNLNQSMIIPSFHRPEIINYIASFIWANGSNNLTAPQMARMVQLIDYACARPLSYRIRNGNTDLVVKNIDFEGRSDVTHLPTLDLDIANLGASTAALRTWVQALTGGVDVSATPQSYNWDVDNDGDGVADSIWIDPNLPLVVSSSGKRLKALVSPLILDMDGRVNMNLAGDVLLKDVNGVTNPYQTAIENGDVNFVRRRNGLTFAAQGLGYGPADISLTRLFNPPSLGQNFTSAVLNFRYGRDQFPGFAGQGTIGRTFHQRELRFNSNGYPYGLRQARRGRASYGTDLLGNLRISDSTTAALTSELVDDSYEVNALGPTQGDEPFTLVEMEGLLRRFDQDVSSLPSRFQQQMTSSLNLNNTIFKSLTMRSVELRHPNMAALNTHTRLYSNREFTALDTTPPTVPTIPLPTPAPSSGLAVPYPRVNSEVGGATLNQPIPTNANRLINNGRQEGSLLRWVQMLYNERYPDVATPQHPSLNLNVDDIRTLFPLEFRKGLRLDINRAFGNGQDEDGDGMVDEPEELFTTVNQQEPFPGPGNTTTFSNGTYFDNTMIQGDTADANYNRFIRPLQSRKMLARQLYVLAQLLVPRDYLFQGVTTPPTIPAPATLSVADLQYQRIRARELAQWAVNVVDFRDTDSAMTRFEYDETPFTRDIVDNVRETSVWEPKGEMVVWGMEFPDLLITETLAFHDKRVKNTSDDTSNQSTTGTPPDDDYDQYRLPQASAFLELFCPRSPGSPQLPSSAGNNDPSAALSPSLFNISGELEIGRLAPTSTGLTMPPGIPTSVDYGRQPIFRVGIAAIPPANVANDNPGVLLSTPNRWDRLAQVTNQISSVPGLRFDQIRNGSIPAAQKTAFNSSGLTSDLNGPTAVAPVAFDRIVWFTNSSVGATQSIPNLKYGEDPADPYFAERQHRIYRNASNAPTQLTLPSGRYLVVGPREETFIGSLNNLAAPPIYAPSSQVIRLNTNSIDVLDINGTSSVPATSFAPPVTMIAITEPPSGPSLTGAWKVQPPSLPPNLYPAPLVAIPGFDAGIGFNISAPTPAPARFYPLPTKTLNRSSNPPFPESDTWADISLSERTLLDEPLDYDPDAFFERLAADSNRHNSGTYLNHRIAYLQRLADPDLPYHPTLNPYITIDWMNMDLTVFNGEDIPEPPAMPQTPEMLPQAGSTSFAFQSRYKDGARANDAHQSVDSVLTANANRYASLEPTPVTTVQTGVTFFSSSTAEVVRSTAGLAANNPYFAHVLGIATPGGAATSSLSLGFLNIGRPNTAGQYDGFGPTGTMAGNFIGAPPHTPAGLNWLDRPFANPYEVMLVPRTSPGQLGQSFTTPGRPSTITIPPPPPAIQFATTEDRYKVNAAHVGGNLPPGFGHLIPFFSSDELKLNTAGNPRPGYWQHTNYDPATADARGMDMHLILELIETEQPYEDTDVFVDPARMNLATTLGFQTLSKYQAPFNRFSKYVAPGKINLNTISERAVWESLEWAFDKRAREGNSNVFKWAEVKNDRRGFAIGQASNQSNFLGNLSNVLLHPSIPTQFRGVYRSPFVSNMDVVNQPTIPVSVPTSTLSQSAYVMRDHRSIASGVLRPVASPTGPNGELKTLGNHAMIHQIDKESVNGTPGTLVLESYLDSEFRRSSFTNYQRAMRLPNLTTNQSNVFAVWITIGLFEYDPEDGIGREYVGPSGVPERSKSFYVVDRSIPVGFAPGKQYNTDKTILLRRKVSE